MVRKVLERSVRWAICMVRRLRVTLLYLADGSSRLDMIAMATHLWYSSQIEGALKPKLEVSSCIIMIAVAVLFHDGCCSAFSKNQAHAYSVPAVGIKSMHQEYQNYVSLVG